MAAMLFLCASHESYSPYLYVKQFFWFLNVCWQEHVCRIAST